MKITRRRMVASLGTLAVAAVGIDATLIEPRSHEVTRHRLGRDDADAEGSELRLVQLTDLHLQVVTDHEEEIAASVAELDPDLLLLTGDTVDHVCGLSVLPDFLDLLDPGLDKYAILGNWERWARIEVKELRRVLEAANCDLLVNRSVVHRHGDARLLITGLDDLVGGRPEVAAALEDAPSAPNHLLLAHCPEHRDVLGFSVRRDEASGGGERPPPGAVTPEWGDRPAPDCILSGHTHGGQVAFFGWAPVRPAGCGRYVSGWYREVEAAMYVSRGLGTSGLPIRFGAMPEVAVFDWKLALGS